MRYAIALLTAGLVDILLCSLLLLLLLLLLFVVLLLLCCIKPLPLSQPRGFVFDSLCGGGAAAAWSQSPSGTKPPHMGRAEDHQATPCCQQQGPSGVSGQTGGTVPLPGDGVGWCWQRGQFGCWGGGTRGCASVPLGVTGGGQGHHAVLLDAAGDSSTGDHGRH